MRLQWLATSLLTLFSANEMAAQDLSEEKFDHYTTAQGMSNNSVWAITQDSAGYMWVATSYGLNRFNGSRFVQYHSNSDSLSLPSEDIWNMAWLDKHRLSIFASGLHILDTKTNTSRNLFIPYHDLKYQFKYNMIMGALGDEKGNAYILTRSGFYHYDKNYALLFRFDFYNDKQVPVTHFYFGRGVFELDDKRLLIISIAGLYIYDKDKMKLKKMEAGDCPLMDEFLDYPYRDYLFHQSKPGSFFVMRTSSDSVVYINITENKKIISRLAINPIHAEFGWRSKMLMVSDTIFYVTGQNSGFFKFRFYPESGTVKFYPQKYFSPYLCSAILKDKDRNLWVATNRGLFRQNPQRSQVQVANLSPSIEDLFPNVMLDDIYASGDKVYAGARGNAGLFVFDKLTLKQERQILFQHNQDDSRVNHIRSIVQADPSNLMIGTIGPMVFFNMITNKEKKVMPPGWYHPGDWTSDMYKDNKGNIWIGSRNIYKYNTASGKFTNIPTFEQLLSVPFVISEDTSGNIWMAGHGLARYNVSSGKYDLLVDSFPFIKMPDKQINAMVVDHQNNVWFNSNNNGLIGYNISTKQFVHFTRSNGLPDDNVASLIVVNNKLWIACYSGLACLDLATSRVVSFGKEDGFPDMPIVKGARFFYDAPLNQLYIGFSSAIARFNPEDIFQKKVPPHTFIENIVVGGKNSTFLPGQNITTSWKDDDIAISIGSINFSDGNMQRYAYRIVKDSNTAWTQLGSQPSFNISSLSPGIHTIQVKTYSPNNRWPEQIKEINLTVSPPVWARDWFFILTGSLLLTLLYLFIKWRTNLVRKKEMEKTRIQKLIADDYKNQFELEHISNYFSSSLRDKKTEEEVLWDVAGNLIGRMNYVDCMIYLWNKDKTKMVQKAAFGPKGKPEYISSNVFDVLPGQGVVGHVMQTRQPVLITDTRTDSRYRVDEAFRLSEVCVPIIHNGELMGIIDSEHHLPHYFTDRDINILSTIATLIANKLKQIESEQSLEVKEKELMGINEQLAEARLSALQAQMNPHFVFNALNSIKRMILEGDNEKASRYLSKFALMIRMTLNHSKEIFVTLDENIEYLKAYLEMEQLRFDDSFKYSIEMDGNIDVTETTIPSMMIQPLVENAIWHGLMPGDKDKKIRIKFTEGENKITCIIEDNGIGIRQSEKLKERNRPAHQSVGLENLRKRIKIMNEKYDMGCSLKIVDLGETESKGSGTRVVLQFNLINV